MSIIIVKIKKKFNIRISSQNNRKITINLIKGIEENVTDNNKMRHLTDR